MVSRDSQKGIYDRLALESLWRYHEYVKIVEDSGFFVEWQEDLTPHVELSYWWLLHSARECGQAELASDYEKTVAGIQSGDFGW